MRRPLRPCRRARRLRPSALLLVLACGAFALPQAEAQDAAASTPPAAAEVKPAKPQSAVPRLKRYKNE